MKKSIVAILISATLVVSSVVAACDQPAQIVPTAEAPTATAHVGTLPPVVDVTPPKAITDEERLTAMQSSIGMLISDYSIRGPGVPEYVFDISARVAQAKETLRQLDGQRAGLGMLLAQYAAIGTSAPEYVFDAVNRVDQARSEALRTVGLEQ